MRVLSLFVSLFFISCTFDYYKYSNKYDEQKPAVEIEDLEYFNIKGKDKLELKANGINYFLKDRKYIVNNAEFKYLFDAKNVFGKFGTLEGSRNNKNLLFKNNVEFNSDNQDVNYKLSGQDFLWEENNKELSSKSLVKLISDEFEMEGFRFKYNFDINKFYFYSGLKGSLD